MIQVLDLFSGAGGMSFGFAAHKNFVVIGAVDAQVGKPSSKGASIECNSTYHANIGVRPKSIDLGRTSPAQLVKMYSIIPAFDGVLIACPPCTDFSRANPKNHSVDGSRNELTRKVANHIRLLQPKYFVYENAREALLGKHKAHLEVVLKTLDSLGYFVDVEVLNFSDYGLPQTRERVLVVAGRDRKVAGLSKTWRSLGIVPPKRTVGVALSLLSALADNKGIALDTRYPRMTSRVQARLDAIPMDGGSWLDISKEYPELLIPSMRKRLEEQNEGSFSDVYGRMHIGRVAPTIKRECGHVGNGRYSHPTENRLLSISEMSFLQGFPCDYRFVGNSLSNCYRQIGDAVPPLISYQIAASVLSAERNTVTKVRDLYLAKSAISAAVDTTIDLKRPTIYQV
jgi:DNA (cytosine-5)-methyltransferase 1